MEKINIGSVTGPGVGLIFKEMTRRAIKQINNARFDFEKEDKLSYSGILDDMVTSADKAAQEIYVKLIRENFPGIGIVAEEANLKEECSIPEVDAYITVDPLDGTKAFVRGQSHGIGTMIALVIDGKVACACIGDINTGEIYYFRPESDNVHRLSRPEKSQRLLTSVQGSLKDKYALLRTRPTAHHPTIQRMIEDPMHGGLIKDIEITGGSIGISMARLWKQEVGMAVLTANHCTPWDWTPVVGISQKLGYNFYKPTLVGLIPFKPLLSTDIYRINHDIVIFHKGHEEEMLTHFA